MIHNQFFETESGKLVRGHGSGLDGLHWHDDSGTTGATPIDIVEEKWTPRPDIKWFPSTPVGDRESLPYVFDLLWNTKTPNELKAKLGRSCDCQEIREAMEAHGVTLERMKPPALNTCGTCKGTEEVNAYLDGGRKIVVSCPDCSDKKANRRSTH